MTATELRPPEGVSEEFAVPLETERRTLRRVRLGAVWPVLTSGLLAYLGSVWVFPLLSVNHDEPTYLLQAETLRHGALTIRAPSHGLAFVPWLAALRHGRFVFKYTPFHAAFLALGRTVFGSYRISLVLIAVACVAAFAFVARAVLPTRRSALVATWMFALSPLVLVQSATYLSYLSSLTFLLLCIGSYLRAYRGGAKHWWLVAGASAGIAFGCRPFDAVLVLGPLLVHLLWLLYQRRVAWQPAALAAAAAAPFLTLLALANWVMMGSPFRLPFSILDPMDTLGFGWRRLHPTNAPVWFGPRQALEGLWMHLLWFPVFVFGGPALVVLALRNRFRSLPTPTKLVAAIGLSLPVGYLLFWGPYGMSVLWKAHPISYFGPFYWLPVVVPVTLLATLGLRALRVRRPRATAAVVVAMLLVNGVTVAHAVDRNREYTEQSQFTHAYLPQPPPGQQWLVFVPQQYGPYLMHPFTFIRDEPDFGGPVLYALDRGRDNFPVMADHPNRTPFRMRVKGVVNDEPSSRARLTLEPIANLTAASFEVEVTIQNPTSRPHVALQVLLHGREDWIVLDHSSARGRTYNARFRVTADDLTPLTRSISHDVHMRRKRSGLPFTISAIFSPTSSWSRRTVVEWLVWDRTTAAGELVFQAPFDARRMANWPRGHWVWDRKTKLVTVRVRALQGNAPGPWTDVRPPS